MQKDNITALQGNLFAGSPRYADQSPVFSRRSDPATSRMAAESVLRSGRVSARNQKILDFLRSNRGSFTYKELAQRIGEDAVETMRRLNGLRKAGQVVKVGARTCSTNGNLMTTWGARA